MLPGGPFGVYDVTGDTYNVFRPSVVKNDYRLWENIKGGANSTETRGQGLEFFKKRFIWNPNIVFNKDLNTQCYSLFLKHLYPLCPISCNNQAKCDMGVCFSVVFAS